MKKITNFIVNHRYIILITFILLTIFCGYLSTKVTVNSDLTAYLQDTSDTKIGLEIIEEEFSDSSVLQVMFKDLEESEKEKIYEELENISYVSSVSYEIDSEDYNKDEYTLYYVYTEYDATSSKASSIYDEITTRYEDYEIYLEGDIADANASVLETWVITLAVGCATVILVIMSSSYIEPLLFLFVIMLAVVLNSGTNILLGSVSSITSSISAILQMALSMDYSIMLIDRYKSERSKETDKVKAMKNALYKGFKAISSSSITTIVGLIMLIFMSFTIGKDLGLVLAKGVLMSLLCIFTCLPGLIILFDKLISKTSKKTPVIKLNKLGNLIYHIRNLAIPLFLLIFVGSICIKGNLIYDYLGEESTIEEIFPSSNTLVIVYQNEDEDEVSNIINTLENYDNVEEILGYSNTINELLKYDELNDKLSDLGMDSNIDNSLLKIIYYKYYNNEEIKLTLEEFTTFIENNNLSDDLTELNYFIKESEINKERTISDLASILGIDSESLEQLLIYYYSDDIDITLTINEFINFLSNDVLTNSTYASSFDEDTLNNIELLSSFVDKDTINTEMSISDLSSLFGLDEDTVKSICLLKYLEQDSSTTMSIREFIEIISYLKENTTYLDDTDVSTLLSLIPLIENSDTSLDKNSLSLLFASFNEDLVDTIYATLNLDDDTAMTPVYLIELTLNNLSSYLDTDTLNNLNLMYMITTDDTSYSASQMASILNMDNNDLNKIYVLSDYFNNSSSWTLTPYELVEVIMENLDTISLDESLEEQLNLLYLVMNGVNNNTSYSANDLANLIGIDKDNINILYSLYSYEYIDSNLTISLYNLIEYILDINSNIDTTKLKTIYTIMNSSLNDTLYNQEDLYYLLSNLTTDLNRNLIDLIYLYYGTVNNYNDDWVLTIETLINYLNSDIIDDNMFDDFIDEDTKSSLISALDSIKEVKTTFIGNTHSRIIIYTNFDLEGDETYNFIDYIKSSLSSVSNVYLTGDSTMAYEMNKDFASELNFITILTMIAIFIVVAFTFKSLLIPLILVLIVQCAVFLTLGILTLCSDNVYFLVILIVQSILMGATIDYAILYTSYYLELRKELSVKEALIKAYNNSIHTILTSASILIIVTFIVGSMTTGITSSTCTSIALGTICSLVLILLVLPMTLAFLDRFIVKKKAVKKLND